MSPDAAANGQWSQVSDNVEQGQHTEGVSRLCETFTAATSQIREHRTTGPRTGNAQPTGFRPITGH
jgi:hypothetical protein